MEVHQIRQLNSAKQLVMALARSDLGKPGLSVALSRLSPQIASRLQLYLLSNEDSSPALAQDLNP